MPDDQPAAPEGPRPDEHRPAPATMAARALGALARRRGKSDGRGASEPDGRAEADAGRVPPDATGAGPVSADGPEVESLSPDDIEDESVPPGAPGVASVPSDVADAEPAPPGATSAELAPPGAPEAGAGTPDASVVESVSPGGIGVEPVPSAAVEDEPVETPTHGTHGAVPGGASGTSAAAHAEEVCAPEGRDDAEPASPPDGHPDDDRDGPVEISVTSRSRAWRGMAVLVLREWAIVLGLLGLAAAIVTFVQRVIAGGLTAEEVVTLLLVAPLAYALLLALGGGVVVAAVVVAVLAPAGLRLGRGGFVAAAVGAWAVGALVTLAFFGVASVPLLATGLAALLHVGTLLWRFRRQDRQAGAADSAEAFAA